MHILITLYHIMRSNWRISGHHFKLCVLLFFMWSISMFWLVHLKLLLCSPTSFLRVLHCVQVMSNYNTGLLAKQERCKHFIIRQLEVSGREVTEEEVNDMVATGKWEVFNENLLNDARITRSQLSEIEQRHKARTFRELKSFYWHLCTLWLKLQSVRFESCEERKQKSTKKKKKSTPSLLPLTLMLLRIEKWRSNKSPYRRSWLIYWFIDHQIIWSNPKLLYHAKGLRGESCALEQPFGRGHIVTAPMLNFLYTGFAFLPGNPSDSIKQTI